jgi:26S proteasome regulatory subunit N1
MDSPYNLLFILGIGFIIFGNQKDADLMIEATQIDEFPSDLKLYIKTLLTICAYAGSGNVIKIQELQQLVAKKKGEIHEQVKMIAVIGMSIIALGEDIGMEMLPRSFNHFLQFGDVTIKKSVSLAYAVLR